jgi:hypothetical protein
VGKSTDESSTMSHRSDFSTKLTDSLDSDLSPYSESIFVEDDNSFSLLQFLKKTEIFSPAFFNILKKTFYSAETNSPEPQDFLM